MNISVKVSTPLQCIKTVKSTSTKLHVILVDGREISVPLEWYPRLLKATPKQRANYRLIGEGTGIHWPDIDEDLDLEGILGGFPSPEYKKHKS
jgi:hypothetical protein